MSSEPKWNAPSHDLIGKLQSAQRAMAAATEAAELAGWKIDTTGGVEVKEEAVYLSPNIRLGYTVVVRLGASLKERRRAQRQALADLLTPKAGATAS